MQGAKQYSKWVKPLVLAFLLVSMANLGLGETPLKKPPLVQPDTACPCFGARELEFCSITLGQLNTGVDYLNAYCPNPLDSTLDAIEFTSDSEHPETLVCTHRDKETNLSAIVLKWNSALPQSGENKTARAEISNCEQLICKVHHLNFPICKGGKTTL